MPTTSWPNVFCTRDGFNGFLRHRSGTCAHPTHRFEPPTGYTFDSFDIKIIKIINSRLSIESSLEHCSFPSYSRNQLSFSGMSMDSRRRPTTQQLFDRLVHNKRSSVDGGSPIIFTTWRSKIYLQQLKKWIQQLKKWIWSKSASSQVVTDLIHETGPVSAHNGENSTIFSLSVSGGKSQATLSRELHGHFG